MADDPNKPRVTLPSESTEIPSVPQRNSNADPPGPLQIVGSNQRWFGKGGLREAIIGDKEQNGRSSERTVVSEGASLPRTWREAIPYVVWVVLVLGFGLEFVAALVRGEWLHLIVSSVGLVGLMAAALHWNQLRSWATRINPNWVVGAFALLLLAIVLAPFVEQRRWPFIGHFALPTTAPPIVIHTPPTAEDIAKATAPTQTALDEMTRQRDTAIRERDAAVADAAQLRAHDQAPAGQSAIPSTIDVLTGAHMIDWLTRRSQGKNISGALFISSPDRYQKLKMAILEILGKGIPGLRFSPLPDPADDFGAPRFPTTKLPGLLVHGDSGLADGIASLFSGCLLVGQTKDAVDGLKIYTKQQEVIWIEIGEGSPWKARPNSMMGECYDKP